MTRTLRQVFVMVAAACAACSISPDATLDHPDDQVGTASDAVAVPPGMHRLRITFAGAGSGYIDVYDITTNQVLGTCETSCSFDVPKGSFIEMVPDTPSIFVGWSGACSGTDYCAVTMSSNQQATATFDHYDREVATLHPGDEVRGVAFARDGNVIVPTATSIDKYKLDGQRVWSTPITGGAYGAAVDTSGQIYTASADTVYALTSAGAVAWTAPVTLDVPATNAFSIESPVQISPDGSVIVVRTPSGVQVFQSDGAPRFATTDARPDGVTVAPDGTVVFGAQRPDFPDQLELRRYAPTGAALASLFPLPGTRTASLVYDAAGNLGSATSALSHLVLASTKPDLTARWQTSIQTPNSNIPQGIVFDSAGELIAAYHSLDPATEGLHILQYDSSGALLWSSLDETPDPYEAGQNLPRGIAADGSKRIAIGGSYHFKPWVAIYQMP